MRKAKRRVAAKGKSRPDAAQAVDAVSFVERLQSRGRHHFTADDAVRSLNASLPAVRGALRRLKQKGRIAMPRREFYVIVPPEYRSLGCLPAEQFVPQLMQHLEQPYYVGLLSGGGTVGCRASTLPQRFQVMTSSPCRRVSCGKVRVDFIVRGDMEETPVIEQNTPRGRLRVASVEGDVSGDCRLC